MHVVCVSFVHFLSFFFNTLRVFFVLTWPVLWTGLGLENFNIWHGREKAFIKLSVWLYELIDIICNFVCCQLIFLFVFKYAAVLSFLYMKRNVLCLWLNKWMIESRFIAMGLGFPWLWWSFTYDWVMPCHDYDRSLLVIESWLTMVMIELHLWLSHASPWLG
jgi:hypothetical protein